MTNKFSGKTLYRKAILEVERDYFDGAYSNACVGGLDTATTAIHAILRVAEMDSKLTEKGYKELEKLVEDFIGAEIKD